MDLTGRTALADDLPAVDLLVDNAGRMTGGLLEEQDIDEVYAMFQVNPIAVAHLGVLTQPAPQAFDVSLPVSVSDGVPVAGVGNLETTASEDVYEFTTAALGGVHVTVSSCASSLLRYQLEVARTAALARTS